MSLGTCDDTSFNFLDSIAVSLDHHFITAFSSAPISECIHQSGNMGQNCVVETKVCTDFSKLHFLLLNFTTTHAMQVITLNSMASS
jgi:hypothetical protein